MMLVTDPTKRCRVQDILDHNWLSQGSVPQLSNHNPLISQFDLSVDVHLDILQAMPKGWTKEQIET